MNNSTITGYLPICIKSNFTGGSDNNYVLYNFNDYYLWNKWIFPEKAHAIISRNNVLKIISN